jgi:lycopene cyclase domain-containing protein
LSLLYLWINLAVLAVPLALSFDRRVAFYKRWPQVLPALALNAALFIAWDAGFTAAGIWGFNPRYLSGLELFGLPIEEVMFFFTIPYACVFLYETLRVYTSWNPGGKAVWWINQLVAGALLVSAVTLGQGRWYTLSAFSAAAVMLMVTRALEVSWMGRFWIFYLLQLLPFFMVNGILTGSFLPEPVVWYSDAHNLGVRLGTVPLEDAFYGMAMLLLPLTLFEWLRARAAKPALAS